MFSPTTTELRSLARSIVVIFLLMMVLVEYIFGFRLILTYYLVMENLSRFYLLILQYILLERLLPSKTQNKYTNRG